MQPEIWIAQELRRIGDEFNASHCPRRVKHFLKKIICCNPILKLCMQRKVHIRMVYHAFIKLSPR
uniref:Bcl-x interacting BH3 domain-containing protein n=1 Tax=Anolis carolinensis TaxID=28377 RepID=A0A803SRF0_ANOCA